MQELLNKLRGIVQEINQPDGKKEIAISEGDFERAACLRDLADGIRKHVAYLTDNKPKRYATAQDVQEILEQHSAHLYETLCLPPGEAQLSFRLRNNVPVVSVAVKKGATKGVPTQIQWELPDRILLVRLEMALQD